MIKPVPNGWSRMSDARDSVARQLDAVLQAIQEQAAYVVMLAAIAKAKSGGGAV